MTKIILVRHGQTVWNPQGRPRGRSEIPLDEVGLLQVRAAAQYIATHWHVDAIYASPLRRTTQTAREIASLLDLDVVSHNGLVDLDFGAWEGRLPEDLEAHWADAWQTWLAHPHQAVIPGGETLQSAQTRAMAALRQICLNHLDDTVAVVSHTAINRLLVMDILDIGINRFWHIGQDMAAINVLDFDGQTYRLQKLNLTDHLTDRR